jgi:phenylacetate-CoA ligase
MEGGNMGSKDFWDERNMTMDRKEMEQIQLEKLKKQLRYEYDSSPFYRGRIEAANIIPEKLKSLEELQKIAIFTKDEHRKSQEQSLKEFDHPYGLHVCAPTDKIVLVNATSGTTGIPTFYTFTKRDLETNNECTSRALWWAGVRPGDTVLVGFALSMFVGGVPLVEAIQHLGAKALPIGAEGGTKRLLEFASLTRATHMVLTPSFAEHLNGKCQETLGKEIKELGFRTLICGGEAGAGDSAVRAKLERAYGAKIYDWMGGAYGFMCICCEDYQGMHHVSPDHTILELVDPETKETLKMEDGGVGNIAYTSLDWEAGPILRYDMGDVTQVFTSPCSCGLTGIRLKVIGRSDDMLIVKGINVYPTAVKNLVTEFHPRTSGEIRIVLDQPGPKVPAPLHIKVEHSKEERDLRKLKADIESRIHDVMRFNAEVTLVPEGILERTTTKAKLVEKTFEQKG